MSTATGASRFAPDPTEASHARGFVSINSDLDGRQRLLAAPVFRRLLPGRSVGLHPMTRKWGRWLMAPFIVVGALLPVPGLLLTVFGHATASDGRIFVGGLGAATIVVAAGFVGMVRSLRARRR